MTAPVDIAPFIGTKIGSRTVLGPAPNKGRYIAWRVRCDCGAEGDVVAAELRHRKQMCCPSCKTWKSGTGARHWMGGEFLPNTLMARYKHSAAQRNLEFSITVQDIERLYRQQSGRCALSGVELICPTAKLEKESNLSIDRLNNAIGYRPDNIQLTTKIANLARHDANLSDFIALCCAVADHARAAA